MDFLSGGPAALAEGVAVCTSLIVAIGAQNAFVLKQGLARSHVFVTALLCSVLDLSLCTAGVLGLGTLFQVFPFLLRGITWVGAAYLAWFGVVSLVRAWKSESLESSAETSSQSLGRTVVLLLGFTLLNPHVWLDMILLGTLGGRHPPAEQPWFVAGAALVSFTWFFGVSYGAALLAPLFRRPLTWRVLDVVIGITVLSLALLLGFESLAG
ncbi:MAG: LysE/ArgO family amino acid transporter [Spirochaetales bacterium]